MQSGKNLNVHDLTYFNAKLTEQQQGIVTTTIDIEGQEVVAYLGIVSGQTVVGLHFLKDMVIGFTDFFGGRSGIMERNFQTAQEDAVKQMTENSKKMGGNAVVGVSINFNPIEGGGKQMLMVTATGTSVVTRVKK